jgi:hypothetical protein
VHRDLHHVASLNRCYAHVAGSSRKGTRLRAHVQSRTRTRLAFETLNHGGIRDSVDEEIGGSRVSTNDKRVKRAEEMHAALPKRRKGKGNMR